MQNMPFYASKDALLQCKRASFTTQKGVDWKTEGKEIDKERPNYGLPKPLQGEGMYLAGYRLLGVGEVVGGRFKAKSSWVNSQKSKVFEVKICFVVHNSPIC